MAPSPPPRCAPTGSAPDATVRAAAVESLGLRGTVFTLEAPWGSRRLRSAMPGRHLVPHALAAAAVAEHFAVPLDEVEAALAAGSHADHRMAVVTAASGATLIDDTYNASPVSVSAALDFLGETPLAVRARGATPCWATCWSWVPTRSACTGRSVPRPPASRMPSLAVGERGRWIAEGARKAGLARVDTAADVDEAVTAFDRSTWRRRRRPGAGQGLAWGRARPAGGCAGRQAPMICDRRRPAGWPSPGWSCSDRSTSASSSGSASASRSGPMGRRATSGQGGHADHGRHADGAWW